MHNVHKALQNGIQWYAYVWISLAPGREAALAWDLRPHFFFAYHDRELKFGTQKWRKMICIVYMCVLTLLWTAKRPLLGAESPPFQNFFIYQDRSLKFGMHTAQIKWNTMIVTTGDKTDNRWQRVVPGDKLTMGDDGVQQVTTGDDGVKLQQTRFFTLFTRQRRVYQLV